MNFKSLILLFGICLCAVASAEEFDDHRDFGQYSVHYNIFGSTMLLPEIAASYGIKRSEYENLLNLSVLQPGKVGAVKARVEGTVTDLLGTQKVLSFREISEQGATYYLVPIRVVGKDVLNFEVNVQPEGSTEVLHVKFTKTLYSDLKDDKK